MGGSPPPLGMCTLQIPAPVEPGTPGKKIYFRVPRSHVRFRTADFGFIPGDRD